MADFTFSQLLGAANFTLSSSGEKGHFTGTLNGKELFECTGSTRVVTDIDGVVTGVVVSSQAINPTSILQLRVSVYINGRLLQV